MVRRKLVEPLLSASIAALFVQTQGTKVAASFFSLGYNKMHRTLRDNSNGVIIVAPKNEKAQTGLVVICHGLGDTAEGFVDVAEVCTVQTQLNDNVYSSYVSTTFGHVNYIYVGSRIQITSYQVHSTHSSNATGNDEHGHVDAFMV